MDSLSFISDICGALKDIKRTGWVMSKVPLPESDADHMHRCAMCALLVGQPADERDDYGGCNAIYHPSKIDQTKLLRMALTHDLCESLAGDITPICDPSLLSSKYDKEDQAMQAIRKVVGDPLGMELYDLWKEYEDQQTTEAIYCKDIDKFEMVVQAYEYEKKYLSQRSKAKNDNGNTDDDNTQNRGVTAVTDEPLRRFFVSTSSVMKTPLFRRLDKELRERRTALLKERGWEVTDAEMQK